MLQRLSQEDWRKSTISGKNRRGVWKGFDSLLRNEWNEQGVLEPDAIHALLEQIRLHPIPSQQNLLRETQDPPKP